MRRLSFGCEENRISLPVLPTLRRLSPFCVTPVCLERVRVAGPLRAALCLIAGVPGRMHVLTDC